jgi:hypothetical protein
MSLASSLNEAERLLLELKGEEEAVFRFRRGGLLIYAVNLTQRGPTRQKESEKEKENGNQQHLPHAPAHVRVIIGDTVVDLPILYANTPFGTLKNTITEYLFTYYEENKPEVLEHIYDVDTIAVKYKELLKEASSIAGKEVKPDWVCVLAASLFRMKPPILGVRFSSHSKRGEILRTSARIVWLNPLFKFWGIGISKWSPSRSVTSSIAIPVVEDFKVISKEAHELRNGILTVFPDLKNELEIPRVSFSELTNIEASIEEIQTVEGILRGINFINGIKLRDSIDQDFRRLGYKITEEMRNFPVKGGKKKGKSKNQSKNEENGESSFDIVTATPVRVVYSGPLMMVSLFSPGTRTGRHTITEIASFATALRELNKLGSNDNIMRIYSYFEFENLRTGEVLKLSTVTGFGERKENDTVRKLANHFEDKFDNLDYHKVLVPLSIGLLTVHLGEGRE